MHATFQNLMSDATRLTRAGNLQAATAAIQAALGGAAATAPAATADPTVIDVEAIEIASDAPLPASRAAQAADTVQAADAVQAADTPHPRDCFIADSHAEGAGHLAYKLYIPPGAGEAQPLVMMLHGCTQNPDDFALGTGMNDLARAHGMYVLYPAQAQRANSARCWNWFKHNHQGRGRGEPALLAGMVRDVMRRYAIDPSRVYVAGLSAGGAMAAILGDAYPELFAAVGVHSGLPTGAATTMQAALGVMKTGASHAVRRATSPPTIVFHGDQDTTVHPANGEQVVNASASGSAAQQQRTQRTQGEGGRDYTRRVYQQADGKVVAEHWAVHGAGHAWSGGRPQGSYTDASGPDASREMLRFFLDHPLATAR